MYFDNGATTLQKPAAVGRAVRRAMKLCASPGRGGYCAAMQAADAVYHCREVAAALFETTPERVAFTMNATHGLNYAIHSLVRPGDPVVVSGFEHNAVMRPLALLGADVAVAGRRLFEPADTLAAFDAAITPQTKAVICTHVSNVFGYILPVEEIAALCRMRGVPFVLDASQSAGTLQVSMERLQAEFIAMPGHKGLYGPQGTGILLCGGMLPAPLIAGGTGSQSRLLQMPMELPDRVEPGTHNVPGICGLAAGMEFVQRRGTAQILRQEQRLLTHLKTALQKTPGLRLFTAENGAQSGTVSLQANGWDCEQLAELLARRRIAVRAGLHCAPVAHESAETLESGTVRISFSAFNTMRETTRLAAVIRHILADCDRKDTEKT